MKAAVPIAPCAPTLLLSKKLLLSKQLLVIASLAVASGGLYMHWLGYSYGVGGGVGLT